MKRHEGAQLGAGAQLRIPGLSLTLWGDVPLGSGLSSSAAVEVATAAAAVDLVGAKYSGPELARLCQRAENQFVGSACGIMDQFVSVNARAGSCAAAGLQGFELPAGADSGGCGAGDCQHHGAARGDRR